MKHKVCSLSALKEKGKMRVLVNERPILIALVGEKVYAINDKCPHKGAPLSPGILEGGIIQCKEHGLKIDVTTGMVVPSTKAKILVPNSDAQSVRTFKASVEAGQVYIEI